jgi:hypothetical protein
MLHYQSNPNCRDRRDWRQGFKNSHVLTSLVDRIRRHYSSPQILSRNTERSAFDAFAEGVISGAKPGCRRKADEPGSARSVVCLSDGAAIVTRCGMRLGHQSGSPANVLREFAESISPKLRMDSVNARADEFAV